MADGGYAELTENDIEAAEIIEILMLCDQYRIECDDDDKEENLKTKLKERIKTWRESSQAQFPVFSKSVAEQISENVRERKVSIKNLFSKMIQLVNSNEFCGEVLTIKQLEKRYRNFKSQIQQHYTDIEEKECTIIVTGETSAGKSSVMNLILGDDILPVSTLKCTGAICRLRYSEQKKVVVIPSRGPPLKFELTSKEEFKDTVKKYTRVSQGEVTDTIDFVDLYWPITLKLENVVFLDTPGVSDDDTLAQRLYAYLPNAVALIYILNSTNDGGVQEDRIFKIIFEWQRDHGLGDDKFDPETTLFICNKWDEVNDDERPAVKKCIQRRLASTWPRLNEAPLVQMSVPEITKAYPNEEAYAQHKIFRDKIINLIQVGFRTELMAHLRWISVCTYAIVHIIETQEYFYQKDRDERITLIDRTLLQLSKLDDDFHKIKTKTDEDKKKTIDKLAKKLFKHIHSPTVRKRITSWTLDDCPEVTTGDPKKVYEKLIKTKLQSEIILWYNDGNMASEIEDLNKVLKNYFTKLEEELEFIKVDMHKKTDSLKEECTTSYMASDVQDNSRKNRHNWIFGIVSFFDSSIANFVDRWRCNKDRLKYMRECTDKVLSELTEARLTDIIREDIMKLDKEIAQNFDKFLQDEHIFLEELKNESVLPGKRKNRENIISTCKCLLKEIEQEEGELKRNFKDDEIMKG